MCRTCVNVCIDRRVDVTEHFLCMPVDIFTDNYMITWTWTCVWACVWTHVQTCEYRLRIGTCICICIGMCIDTCVYAYA